MVSDLNVEKNRIKTPKSLQCLKARNRLRSDVVTEWISPYPSNPFLPVVQHEFKVAQNSNISLRNLVSNFDISLRWLETVIIP